MSRADGAPEGGAAAGAVDSPVFGAFVPRWFELAVLCAVAFVAGYGLSSLVFAVIGAFHVVLVIAVSLNVGLLCALGVLRLPPRARRSASVARRDRGSRGHRGRRRRDDRDERVGAEPARAVDPRSGHLPHHRQVAVRAEPAPDRRGSRAVRDVGRGEPGLRARLLPRRAIPTTRRGRAICSRSSSTCTRRCSATPTGSAATGSRRPCPRSSAASRCSRCSCSGVDGCRPGRRRVRRSPSRCRCRRRSSAATRSQRCRCSSSSAEASRSRCGR